jgi:hypothetical protein
MDSTSKTVDEALSPSPSSSEEALSLQQKKRKKKTYAQKYQESWEQDVIFKS